MKRILLISAHPDDMEIGMGGTVAKLAKDENSLVSIVITDGRRSPDPDSIGHDSMARLRKEEGETACRVLGVNETHFFAFKSMATEDVCDQAIEHLVEVIDRIQPEEVFTLHPELDRHPSHRAAGKITIEALDMANSTAEVWAYEVWGLFPSWDRFEDISEYIDIKISAINEHRSQVAAINYADGIAGLNRWRGVFADPHQQVSPARYAEVFVKLR